MQASLGCWCWIHSAEFWGWSTAVGTLVSSIPPWFSWEFSPEPQVVGESCWQLLALIITSQSQSISSFLLLLPSSFLPHSRGFSPLVGGLQLQESCRKQMWLVFRGRAVAEGTEGPQSPARGWGQLSHPVLPAQHWAPLVMPPIRTAPGTGSWPAWNQKIGPVVVFWGFQLYKGFRSALDKSLSSSFCGTWIFFLLTSMCFGSGSCLG